MTYPDRSRGLMYHIVGFMVEDGTYETYHARAKGTVKRDVILHLLRNGNDRRFPKAKLETDVIVTAQKPSATREKAILPWKGDGRDKEMEAY